MRAPFLNSHALLCCATVIGGVGAGIAALLAIIGWVSRKMTSVRRANLPPDTEQKGSKQGAAPKHSSESAILKKAAPAAVRDDSSLKVMIDSVDFDHHQVDSVDFEGQHQAPGDDHVQCMMESILYVL
jgi:hypothetical protein